jgi:MFS family permease
LTVKSRYPLYVLFIVGLVSILNYYDRSLLSILVEPIKRDLRISDGEIGLLAGVGFALIYGVLGVPMARLADRYGRAPVLGAVLMFWSAMTAATGATANFTTIFLARIGVGLGEAGGLPAVHALIAEYFSLRRRGLAMSVSGICGAIGVSLALILGGSINDLYGWRRAFYLAAVPGLLLAVVIFLTIRDPRSHTHPASERVITVPLGAALRTLWGRKSFMLLCLGMGIGTIGSYGQQAWTPAFLMRTYHLTAGQVGSRYAAVIGPASILSILLGGVINDWLVSKDERWPLWLLALSFGLCAPAGLVFFLVPDFTLAMVMAVIFTLLGYLWVGPAYALVQALAGAQLRALAAAVFMLIINIIGNGLGPTLTGLLSEQLRAALGPASLRASLCIMIMTCALATIPFLLATRAVKTDMTAANS